MEGLLSTGPLRRLVFEQSSPVHPVSESRGGSPRVTEEEKDRPTEGPKLSLILDDTDPDDCHNIV